MFILFDIVYVHYSTLKCVIDPIVCERGDDLPYNLKTSPTESDVAKILDSNHRGEINIGQKRKSARA